MSGLHPTERIALSQFCANGNDEALAFIETIGRCVRRVDDVADGDSIDVVSDLTRIVTDLLMLQANPFFQANMASLLPPLVLGIQNWAESELNRRSDLEQTRALAFVQRDAILACGQVVALLTGGPEHAREAMRRLQQGYYGPGTETFAAWQAETEAMADGTV